MSDNIIRSVAIREEFFEFIFSTELDDYDSLNYDEINDQSGRSIYGNIAEAIEFEAMQNPYYGGEMDEEPTAIKTMQKPYYVGDI